MRVADSEIDELLVWIRLDFCDGDGFDRGTVANADEAEDGGVAFRNAEDVILEVGTSCS